MRLNSPKPNNGFMEISSISNEIRNLHRGPCPHLGDGSEILATPASIASTETFVQAKDRGGSCSSPALGPVRTIRYGAGTLWRDRSNGTLRGHPTNGHR